MSHKKQIVSTIAHFAWIGVSKLVVVTVAVLFIWFAIIALGTWEERRGLKPISATGGEVEALPAGLLASRIIDMEVDAGLATEPDKARQILAALLHQARAIQPPAVPTAITVRAYFKNISLLIDRHYYYRRSTTFTVGLIEGGLDCDLRSILFQSIAAASGLDIGIIYTPGHAFVGWQAPENGVSVYWETTVPNGQAVVLSDTSIYRPSSDPADYRILTQAESEDFYGSWIYADAYERHRDAANLDKVIALAERHPTWHYPQLTKLFSLFKAYGIQNEHTQDQLQAYSALNRTDDWVKRMRMFHYKAQGDKGMALAMFHEITKSALEPDDFDVAAQLSDSPTEWLKYKAVAVTFDSLRKFKQTLFYKLLQWSEYSTILILIVMFTLIWLITPLLLQLSKVLFTRKAMTCS